MDSSVDEEMLDKIKNIYSEMRMNNNVSGYSVFNPAGGAPTSSITVIKNPQKKGVIMKPSNSSPGKSTQLQQ